MKKGIYIAVIVLLAITLVVSGIYLFNYFWEGKKEADRYQQLANIVQESRQETETTAATEPSASSEPTETAEFIPDPDNLDPEEGFQERMTTSSPSLIRPMAIPETGAEMGTPASISAKVEPQVEAMELDPLDSRISETTRMA